MSDVRLSTTMYRFLVSFVIFGIIGYVLALTLEKKYTRNNLISSNTKGQNVDIVSEQELTGGDSSKQDSFIPLTPDKLEHISARKE